MEAVRTIEKKLVEINKGLPKLPKDMTAWLANYAWLLVLLGVTVSILSLFTILPVLLGALGLVSVIEAQYGLSRYGLDAAGWLSVVLSIINLLIVICLEILAIAPLKRKNYRGWELIFIASLVSIIVGIAGSIIVMQPGSLVLSLVVYGIGLYVLFQVREHFAPHVTKNTKASDKKPNLKTAAAKK